MVARHLGCIGGSPETTTTVAANGISYDGPARYDGLTTYGYDAALARNGPVVDESQRHDAIAANDAVVDDATVNDDVAATAVDADASYAELTVANDEPGIQSTDANATTNDVIADDAVADDVTAHDVATYDGSRLWWWRSLSSG